jgi:hypothetical protein
MIRLEALSHEQKRFLLKRYRVDVDDPVRFRRRYRFAIMFSWIGPLLAVGLLWDGTPGSAAFSGKPAEFVAWCLVVFRVFGDAFLFAFAWKNARPGASDETYAWHSLFEDRIRPPAPPFLRWVGLSSSIAIVLVTALTGRPLLAAAWVCMIIASIARGSWGDRIVRCELDRIDSEEIKPALPT